MKNLEEAKDIELKTYLTFENEEKDEKEDILNLKILR